MKRLIKFGSIGLVMAGAIAISGEAFAQVTVYSTQTPEGYELSIVGTPRTQIPVTVSSGGSTVTKSFRANGCGHVVIPNAASLANLNVGGQFRNVTQALTASPIALPTCQGTTSSTLPATHDTNSSIGTWNLGDGKILATVPVAANAPNGRLIDATYLDNSPKSRFVTLNACGIGKVTKLSSSANVSVDGAAAALVSSFTDLGSPLRCKGNLLMGSSQSFDFSSTPLPFVFRDANNSVFIAASGGAGATVSVGLASQSQTRSLTSDRCGGLTVGTKTNPQTTPFTIGSDTIDPATLSTGLKPSCKLTGGSYAYDVTPSGNFKTSDGQVFVKSTAGNPTGFGDRRIVSVVTTAASTRNLKADQCGIATIRSTTSSPIANSFGFSYDGSNYTVGSLPVAEVACVNAGTSASPDYELYRKLP